MGRSRIPGLTGLASMGGSRFRLTRYFTITSLVAFTVVGIVLYHLESKEEIFFEQVQAEQTAFFSKAQRQLSSQQEDTERRELVAVHEAGHVNLARFLANMLWEKNIAPFMAKVQQLPIDRCRALPSVQNTGRTSAVNPRQTCFANIGRQIRALPKFSALDSTAYTAMRTSTVFKIKVFDLRGTTVYSSEHAQIGEDKAENLGWKIAVSGRPASELTHRDRFSAFEGVVENRDLISSYIPVRTPGKDEIVGVFEIYSDVTPFLAHITKAADRIHELTAANLAKVERAAAVNQEKVNSSSNVFLATVGSLLALLYISLLVLVRNGQRIIDDQTRVQEQTARRERRWHREKMAALATMAAHVSHELGTPLATISGLAEDIADQYHGGGESTNQSRQILEQTRRIAAMIRQIADFASARSEKPELVDINQMAKAICDFLGFDSRFSATRIEFRPDRQVPACVVIPDHLNEVLIGLLQACVEGESKPARIVLETKLDAGAALINIRCESAGAGEIFSLGDFFRDSRFESAQRRIAEMRGQLLPMGSGVRIALSPTEAPT